MPHTRIRPLRVRHNAKILAWAQEPGRGKEASRRRDAKLYYAWIAGVMLRPNWEDLDGNLSYAKACEILKTHRDFPKHKTSTTQRQWLSRTLKLVCTMPNVVKMPRFIMLITLLEDHGGWDAIAKHHEHLGRARRRTFAKASQKTRDSAKYWASQAHKQIVNIQPSCVLTEKTTDLYNASSPKQAIAPQPQQAAGFVASPPKRANAVSANRAKAAQPTKPLASFSSRSDKPLAQPGIPSWLKADAMRPDFDPRTNPAARRIYGHTPIDQAFVAMLKREHKQLANLSYPALHRRHATVETLMAACHLLTRKKSVTKPVNWVMWAEKWLREGKGRYA